jgi:hypothetical protein
VTRGRWWLLLGLVLAAAVCLRVALLIGPPDQLYDAGDGQAARIYHEEAACCRGPAGR